MCFSEKLYAEKPKIYCRSQQPISKSSFSEKPKALLFREAQKQKLKQTRPKNLCDLLSQDDQDIYLGYIPCDIRHNAAKVLTMLEKEFARETAGGTPSDKSEKPIGVSAVRYLSCEESDSTENSKKDVNEHCVKDNNTKGKKRRNKNSNKQAEKKKLKKEKRKLEEEERKLEKRRLKKERRLKKNGNEAKVEV